MVVGGLFRCGHALTGTGTDPQADDITFSTGAAVAGGLLFYDGPIVAATLYAVWWLWDQ